MSFSSSSRSRRARSRSRSSRSPSSSPRKRARGRSRSRSPSSSRRHTLISIEDVWEEGRYHQALHYYKLYELTAGSIEQIAGLPDCETVQDSLCELMRAYNGCVRFFNGLRLSAAAMARYPPNYTAPERPYHTNGFAVTGLRRAWTTAAARHAALMAINAWVACADLTNRRLVKEAHSLLGQWCNDPTSRIEDINLVLRQCFDPWISVLLNVAGNYNTMCAVTERHLFAPLKCLLDTLAEAGLPPGMRERILYSNLVG